MEMMRKIPKKSNNYGIKYPMIEESKTCVNHITQLSVYDSNGNYIRRISRNNKSTVRDSD